MILAINCLLLFIILLFSQEIFRRFRWFALAFFVLLPFFIVPYWRIIGVDIWFTWVKMFLVDIGLIWFSVFRLTNFSEKKIAKIGVYLILVANILEAVFLDILGNGIAHNLNAIAGIFLLLTLNKIDSITTTKDKYLDVSWRGMTMMWIFGYTIWNLTFVYLNFPQLFFENIAVLAVSLFIAFVNRGRWLQTRALTLGVYLILLYPSFSIWPRTQNYYQVSVFFGESLAKASLIFMIIYTIIFLRSKRTCG